MARSSSTATRTGRPQEIDLFWFMLIALVVVVAAVALAVLGNGDALPEAEHDRLDDPLPADRPVHPGDLEGLRLAVTLRGYRMADVDDVLDRLGAELAERDARIAELESALTPGQYAAGPAGPPPAPPARPASPPPAGPPIGRQPYAPEQGGAPAYGGRRPYQRQPYGRQAGSGEPPVVPTEPIEPDFDPWARPGE
jgi:DivIVA domain-containing protein